MSKSKPMNQAQIALHLEEKFGLPRGTGRGILDAIASLAQAEVVRAGEFNVPGVGKLVVRDTAARTGRNPATGEAIQIPAKTTLKFRVAKAAKDAVASTKTSE